MVFVLLKFMEVIFFFFFFSSRRRHTRYIGDWSSDVCSSDLVPAPRVPPRRRAVDRPLEARDVGEVLEVPARREGREKVRERRSEERRVGKECSTWGAA